MPITDKQSPPILYSFRRCPYAMRARMALSYSELQIELREVDLRNKPAELINVSPKATVPVLLIDENHVIDESLDIMQWSLSLFDPKSWLYPDNEQLNIAQTQLIQENDQDFKPLLDQYKYADRHPEHTQQTYRDRTLPFLNKLEQRLRHQPYLMDENMRLVDVALFPFIRQYAFVDIAWFDNSPYPNLRNWLSVFLNHHLFKRVMNKQSVWMTNDKPCYLPLS